MSASIGSRSIGVFVESPEAFSEKWELKSISLGCVPFGGSHTALRTLDLIKEVNYKLQTTTTYIYVADINMTFFDRF